MAANPPGTRSTKDRQTQQRATRTRSPLLTYGPLLLFTILLFPGPDRLSAKETGDSYWSDLGENRDYYGSEKEEKFPVRALVVEEEKWKDHFALSLFGIYKYTDYPEFVSHRLLIIPAPLFYSLKSKKDNRQKAWLFPLWYYKKAGSASTVVTPVGFRSVDSAKRDYSLLYLLYFGSSPEEGAGSESVQGSHISLFPLFSWERSESSASRESRFISWIFYNKTEGHLLSGGETHDSLASISPLHGYFKKTGVSSDGKERVLTKSIFFPLLPFLYFSSTDGQRSTTSLLTLFNIKRAEGKTEHLWLHPLFYYRPGENGYLNVVPFYFSGGNSRKSHRYVLPFYYSTVENSGSEYPEAKKEGEADEKAGPTRQITNALIPFYFYKGNDHGDSLLATPLYYLRKEGDKSHTSIAYIIHWRSEGGKLKSLFLPPLLYRSESYLHFVPFYFSNWSVKDDESTLFGPVYYRHRKGLASQNLVANVWYSHDPEDRTSSLHIFPLLSYTKSLSPELDAAGSSGPEEKRYTTRFWMPVVPLFYRSHVTGGDTHYNIAWILDWKRGAEGDLSRFWLLPALLYKKNGYLYSPLYVRPGPYDAIAGTSFAPLYYHSWSPDSMRLFAGPYYESHDLKANEAYTHFFPLYYQWENPESKGRVVLPFQVTYEDHTKYMDFTLGVWRSRRSGMVQPDLSVGEKEGRWYLDSDWSFLYNLISVSTRASLPARAPVASAKEANAPRETAEEISDAPDLSTMERLLSRKEPGTNATSVPANGGGTPGAIGTGGSDGGGIVLKKKEGISRDSSRYYWGYSALYGLVSYARSDSKRHFRMLPLAWFTWDKQSDDRVTILPPFLPLYFHYRSSDVEYRVVLPPLYGKQRKGDSFITAVLGIGWIHEYDAEENRRETSILWPLVNYHTSPVSHGSRFLPFYHYLERRNGDSEISRFTIFPLLFHRKSETIYDTTADGKETIASQSLTSLSPFHLIRQSREKDAESSRMLYPILPLYYRAEDRNGQESSHLSYLFPFYYESAAYDGRSESDTDQTDSLSSRTVLSPLFYYGYTGENRASRFVSLVPYYRFEDSESIHTNVLFFYDSLEDKKADSRRYLLFPFYYGLYQKDSSTTFLAGLYFHSSPTEDRQNGLYLYDRQKSPSESRYRFLFGAVDLRSSKEEKSTKLLYGLLSDYSSRPGEEAYDLSAFFYLYKRSSNKERLTDYLFPLYFYKHSTIPATNYNRTEFGFPFLPVLFYQNKSNIETHYNFLTLFDFDRKSDGTSGRFFAIPIYFHWYSPEESSSFIAGLYVRNDRNGNRQNFLYLADREYVTGPLAGNGDDEDYYYRALFSSFEYIQSSRKGIAGYRSVSLLYGLLGSVAWHPGDPDYESSALFYLFHQEWSSGRASFQSRFFPLYSYNSHFTVAGGEDGTSGGSGGSAVRTDLRFALPYLPFLAYVHASPRERHYNLLTIADYERNDDDQSTRRILFPLYYDYTDPGVHRLFAGGLYLRRDGGGNRQNFLFLYDREFESNSGTTSHGLLLHSIDYEQRTAGPKFTMLYGLLAYYDRTSPTESKLHLGAFLYNHERSGLNVSDILFPIYYYNNENASSHLRFFTPVIPILYYADRDQGSVKNLVGLGTIWYRNGNARESTNTALMGALWYRHEDHIENSGSLRILLGGLIYEDVRKPKRGYRMRGSLWGFLWQYEDESETDFRKFSILKFVYSKTHINGSDYTRILGIRM